MKFGSDIYVRQPRLGETGAWVDGELAEIERALASIAARLPMRGEGSPEGVVTANVGTLYLRTDGGASTTLYVKESGTGNTGWVAK